MTHLGSQISALADGQLSPAAAERAMAHVASCEQCGAELAAARAARRALASAFDVPVAPLTQRLLALGTLCPPARGSRARPAHDVVAAGFGRHSAPLPGSDGGRGGTPYLHADLDGGHRPHRRLGVAAMAGVGVLAAALFALGDLPVVRPDTHPAYALTVLGRAGDTGTSGAATAAAAASGATSSAVRDAAVQQAVLPWSGTTSIGTTSSRTTSSRTAGTGSTDGGSAAPGATQTESFGMPRVDLDLTSDGAQERVADWMRRHGWAPLETLPPGYRITGVRHDAQGGALELDLDGSAGLIVVTQQHGRLSPDLAGMPGAEGEEHVHVLSSAPWHCAWQSGDTVVSVVAEVPSEALATVLDSYPTTDYEDAMAARIARGWAVLARAWRA